MKRALLAIFMLGAVLAHGQVLDAEAAAAQQAVQTLHMAAEGRIAADQQAIADANAKAAAAQAALNDANAQITVLQGRWQNTKIIPAIQKLAWGAGTVGPGIGGSTPAAYGWTRNADGALVLSVTGKAGEYDDWLTGLHLYGLPAPDASRMILDLQMSTDAAALTLAQALELDTLVIADGLRFELSSQINYRLGGMLQVSTGNSDGWHDTGIIPGKLAPDVKHRITWEYAFDRAGKTVSFVAFTFDGVRTLLPAQFHGLAAYPSTWRPQVVLQLQQDTKPVGGTFTSTYDNVTLVIQ